MVEEEAGIDSPRSIIEHLEELRKRIIFSLLFIVICSGLVYNFIPQIMKIIVKPVGRLYFMDPGEAFWIQLKLAFFLGFYCASPFVFYQIWKFVEVGLKQREKSLLLPLASASFILFTLGAGFCYFLVIPTAVKFLLSYGSDVLMPLISVTKYISFISCLVFASGITFQLPLVLLFLARMGMVDNKTLRKFRRFAILFSFIIGAAVTPTPDMVNQTLLALPIIVLYELSIWLIWIFEKRAGKKVASNNA